MSQTVTATYDNDTKALNAYEELVAKDIPRDKLFLDKETNEVKVIIPDPEKREVEEILNRHEPQEVRSRPFEA